MKASTSVVAKVGGVGAVLALILTPAYLASSTKSVAPKAGEGAGITLGGAIIVLKNIPKGLQEMQDPAAPPAAAPPTAPPAAQG